ncbi:MAG: DUF1902 domain-containing protein [Synergistaceae bacterium]|nr:DUF1902 domain-containing protein [Synergistaceae bacterium]
MDCKIKLFWDSDAAVWSATSEDLPGLALESGSFDALVERVKYIVPELLEIENIKVDYCDLNFVSERRDRVQMVG